MIRNILLSSVICVGILIANDSRSNHVSGQTGDLHKEQKYSFPPNNTPISKVYVFGRPVYVRQPFVVPQRDNYRPMHDNHVLRDERSYGPEAEAMGDAVERTLAQESVVKDFLTESDPSGYQLPERPFPSSTNPYAALPPLLEQKQGYPLPQCYTNDSGFMCCNPKLEQVMRDVFDELSSDPRWQPCNVQKIANALQNKTQSVFNTDFEALAGLGDFASKTHFYSDLICKIEVQGRFMLSYATPNRHQTLRPALGEAEMVEMGTSSVGYV